MAIPPNNQALRLSTKGKFCAMAPQEGRNHLVGSW
jgi:hypothetical protein